MHVPGYVEIRSSRDWRSCEHDPPRYGFSGDAREQVGFDHGLVFSVRLEVVGSVGGVICFDNGFVALV
jgi:hypothetical protein